MIKQDYRKHYVGLFAAVILGSGAINLPYGNADRSNVTAFVICFAVFLIAVNTVFSVLKLLNKAGENTLVRLMRIAVYAFIAIICFYTAQKSFDMFAEFVTDRILPYTKKWIAAAVFAVTVMCLALCEGKVLLKFSLISFITFSLIIAVLFCISFKDFDIENISLLSLPDVKSLKNQVLTYLNSIWTLALILPAAMLLYDTKKGVKTLGFGVVAGFLLLCAVLLNSLLIFGPVIAGKTEYPYCDAVSTVTLSRLFTRMDGFAYFVFFATQLIKVTLCITVIKKLLNKLGLKNTAYPTVAMCAVLYFICIF